MVAGAARAIGSPLPGDGCLDFIHTEVAEPAFNMTVVGAFLSSLGLDHLLDIFEKEKVSLKKILF